MPLPTPLPVSAVLDRVRYAFSRKDRPRVVFLHIPKTAGSSINRYFKHYLGSSRSGGSVFFHDRMTTAERVDAMRRAERARYIGGHFGGRMLAEMRRPGDITFTFLRDPVARLRSHYLFDHNRPDGIETARRLSLADYVLSDDGAAVLRTDNVMARQLAVAYDFMQSADMPLDAIAEAAMQTLASLAFVGLVDTIDGDLAALASLCGLPPPRRAPKVNARGGARGAADDAALRALAGQRLDADERVYRNVLAARAATGTIADRPGSV